MRAAAISRTAMASVAEGSCGSQSGWKAVMAIPQWAMARVGIVVGDSAKADVGGLVGRRVGEARRHD